MFEIPKRLHRIWFGSDLPLDYRKNLVILKEKNPEYIVFLHSDSKTMEQEAWDSLTTFCLEHTITLSDIRNIRINNKDLIERELDDSLSRGSTYEKIQNYVRASDLARIAILVEWGEIYTDTEISPHTGFGTLYAQYGFLEAFYPGLWNSSYESIMSQSTGQMCPVVIHIQYDFMAGIPQNELHKVAEKINRLDYEALTKTDCHKIFLYSLDRKIISDTNMSLTGSATKHAYNYLISQGLITNFEAVLLKTERYFNMTRAHSWCPKENTNALSLQEKKEQKSVWENFADTQDNMRHTHYPLYSISLENQLHEKICGYYLYKILSPFSDVQFESMITKLKRDGNFDVIICSIAELRGVLRFQKKLRRDILFNAVKDNLNDLFCKSKDRHVLQDLELILENLDEEQRSVVLDALPPAMRHDRNNIVDAQKTLQQGNTWGSIHSLFAIACEYPRETQAILIGLAVAAVALCVVMFANLAVWPAVGAVAASVLMSSTVTFFVTKPVENLALDRTSLQPNL